MRLRFSALPATLLLAGTALAQAGNPVPNAISLWRSDNLNFIAVGVGATTGQTGQAAWHTLPQDVLIYFKPGSLAREVSFRGFEWAVANFSATTNHNTPVLELQRALQAAAPNEGRLQPEKVTNPGYIPLASFAPVNIGVLPAGVVLHISFDLGAGSAIPVTLTSTGRGVACYVKDYESQAGANSLIQVYSNGVETGPATTSLSGITFPPTIASGGSFWANQLVINPGAIPFTNHEMEVTYLFENSMIQPIKNNQQSSAGGNIVGAPVATTMTTIGINVGTLSGGFYGDNGRGALNFTAGDAISYSGNSDFASAGSFPNAVFFIPFVAFEGDIGGGPGADPIPENWVGNGGTPDNVWVRPVAIVKWVNDVCFILGCSTSTGQLLTTVNPIFAVWFGIDLPVFLNVGLLFNSFAFAGFSGGHAGPETLAVDTTGTPGGKILRNGVDFSGTGAAIFEHATTLFQQHGFTPFASAGLGSGKVGFTLDPGGFASGKTVWVQTWMLDTADFTSGLPTPYNIKAMSTAFRVRL